MARFPLRDTEWGLARDFCAALVACGMEPLPVLARESFAKPDTQWRRQIEEWAIWLGGIRHWQVGNEPDHKSPSSWTMTEPGFSDLLRQARAALPDAYLIAGGMVSGNPDYLIDVDLSSVDAISIHPYGQRPIDWPDKTWGFGWAADLLDRYKGFGKPLWVTEYGGPAEDFSSAALRASYYGHMTRTISLQCAAAFPFKYEDAGVPGFGIEGTLALDAVSKIARTFAGDRNVQEMHNPGGPMKIEDVAAKHGGLYSPVVVLAGTKTKPTARIGWVNDTKDGFVLEINGEAADAVFVPKA